MLDYKKGLHDHGSSDAEGNKNSCVKKYYLATVFFFAQFHHLIRAFQVSYLPTQLHVYHIIFQYHCMDRNNTYTDFRRGGKLLFPFPWL